MTLMTPPPALPDGEGSPAPVVKITYGLTPGERPVSLIRTESYQAVPVGSDATAADVLHSIAIVDGLGRTRSSLAQAESAGDDAYADSHRAPARSIRPG